MKSAFVFAHPLRLHYAALSFIEATFDVSRVERQARGEVFCVCVSVVRACVFVCRCKCRRVWSRHGCSRKVLVAAGRGPIRRPRAVGFSWFCGFGVRRRRGESSRRDLYRSGRCAEGPSPAHRPSSVAKADASNGVGAKEAGVGSGAANSRPPAGQHGGQQQQWGHREQR